MFSNAIIKEIEDERQKDQELKKFNIRHFDIGVFNHLT